MTDISNLADLLHKSLEVSFEIKKDARKAMEALEECFGYCGGMKGGDLLASDLQTVKESLQSIIEATEGT